MYFTIIIAILFIAIASSKTIRDEFMRTMNELKVDDDTKELIYTLILISLFLLIVTLLKHMKYKKMQRRRKEYEYYDNELDGKVREINPEDVQEKTKTKEETKAKEEIKENFFFVPPTDEGRILLRNIKDDKEVSFPPRESIYKSDRPINFQFSTVGSGKCDQGDCQAYGIIKGCPGQKVFGRNQFEDNVL